jgi:hypothetical protein
MDENAQKLQTLLSAMSEDHLGKKDFVTAFEKVLAFVVKIQQEQERAISKLEETYSTILSKMQNDHSMTLADMKKQVDGLFVGEKMDKMMQNHTEKMKAIDAKMANIKNGRDGLNGKDANPNYTAKLASQLIKIPKDTATTDAIQELKTTIEDLKKQVGKGIKYVGGNGGATGGGIVKIHDLSSQLNGVLKTFALPAFWRVLTADLSSFPNVLRPTVDFTTDGAAMTITFTSQIDASSSLSTGQTCIITYAEA